MGARFRLNPAAIQLLQRSPKWSAALEQRAERVAQIAARNARDHDYAETIEVEDHQTFVRVGSAHPFAHLDEWGSVNNPPTGALRRAVQAAGLRFERSGR